MSAFAPKETTPPSGIHPEDEELAAYIDGMLGRKEAARITEHLAACADCYHIYAETVEFQSGSAEQPSVVPFPKREERTSPKVWWLPLAALLLLSAGLGWYIFQRSLAVPRPALTVAEVAPAIQDHPNVEEIVWKHYRPRGGEGGEEELQHQSFQVGALLVDFRLSVQAGDVEQGEDAWRHVGIVVQNALSMDKEGRRLLTQANRIKSVEALRRVASHAPAIEAALGGSNSILFPEYLDFGKWTEAGRVSAILRNPAFFQREENRQFLSYLLSGKDENMVLAPEVREPLQKIERIWDGGPLDENDFQALAESFQAILDQYDFRPSVDEPF